jgi:hypothetical protein
VYVKVIGQQETTLQLTEQPGDYGPPACAQHGDTLWVTHTAYQDKHRSLWLHGIQNGDKVISLALLAPAKIDNPHLSIFEEQMHLVWQAYTSGEAQIKHAVWAPHSLLRGDLAPGTTPVIVTEAKSYKPQLISDGQQLFVLRVVLSRALPVDGALLDVWNRPFLGCDRNRL